MATRITHPNTTSICAILRSSCRLIPIPFLDDSIERKIMRHLVRAILQPDLDKEDQAIQLSNKQIDRMYKFPKGIIVGIIYCLWSLVCKPIKKLFFYCLLPFKIKSIAKQIAETILFGRAVTIAHTLMKETVNLSANVPEFREAFFELSGQYDGKIARKLISSDVFQVTGIHYEAPDDVDHPDPELNEAAADLSNALGQANTKALLQEFDVRFKELFQKAVDREGPPPPKSLWTRIFGR